MLHEDPRTWLTPVVVTMIYVHNLTLASFFLLAHQGFVMNLQPSEAEAGFDVRVPPTADPESLERRITEEWAPASRNMTFQVVITRLKFCLFEPY